MLDAQLEKIPELRTIAESSDYLGRLLQNDNFRHWLWEERNLFKEYPLVGLYKALNEELAGIDDFLHLQKVFRKFKQKHFLRIGGRDFLGWSSLAQSTSQLSDLACVFLQTGMQWLTDNPHAWLSRREQTSAPEKFKDLPLAVIALGKLGGNELNYVSDIDILFIHAKNQEIQDETWEYRGLFRRLVHSLCNLLQDQIEGDRVFNVDLRLRPQGKDGELVPFYEAAVQYYQISGQSWERQVLLKARPIAGDRSLGTAFLQELRPFVFRRFLDFQALDELKSMRNRILQEGRKKREVLRLDLKQRPGGIREIEFIVQSFQLIYGGRYKELNQPNTLSCLDQLVNLQLLPAKAASELGFAYKLLRRMEHWVQLDQNRHSCRLPDNRQILDRMATALRFSGGTEEMLSSLEDNCARVNAHFASLFQEPSQEQYRPAGDWTEKLNHLQPLAGGAGDFFSEFTVRWPFLSREIEELATKTIGGSSAGEATGFVEQARPRLEKFFDQLRTRPGLIKMLNTLPHSLPQVLQLIAKSDLVSGLLSSQPSLIEGLLANEQNRNFQSWVKRAEQILKENQDYEQNLEWIRRLKNERLLLLVLFDLAQEMNYYALIWELSELADFVLQHTLDAVAWHIGSALDMPLSVLALGKLGSQEMSYLSDLDLMFVYAPWNDHSQDLPQEVIRLTQRFLRMLGTSLQEGPGYPVDTQLRPTGNYGPLVVTRQRWENYYSREADIWEIQAMLKLRAAAGDKDLGRDLENFAAHVCYQPRTASRVWPRLCQLRGRMEAERGGEKEDNYNLEYGFGGLTDLEFLVQGHQLLFAWQNTLLQQKRCSAVLGEVLDLLDVPAEKIEFLEKIYLELRRLKFRLQIFRGQGSDVVSREQFAGLQESGLWPPSAQGCLIQSWNDLQAARRRIRSVWSDVCANFD